MNWFYTQEYSRRFHTTLKSTKKLIFFLKLNIKFITENTGDITKK